IGQRKGLYLSGGPWFVIKKDIGQNIVYVSRGYDPEAQKQDWLVMRDMHWITLNPTGPDQADLPVKFKIRHVAELNNGVLTRRADGSYFLKMEKKTNGVAPGQFCCIYTPDGKICLGSGEISWE
ncbi:MAG: tRNA 2-thiouridine(34) synthase MnmA, partial [Bacteroidales bacterium]|nr:tRNA 2-thiouridine(34) synthase MnmA [Bacteroidales bacterium]